MMQNTIHQELLRIGDPPSDVLVTVRLPTIYSGSRWAWIAYAVAPDGFEEIGNGGGCDSISGAVLAARNACIPTDG